jgi:DNA-binding response OmpR family regulator
MPIILIVDDDTNLNWTVNRLLQNHGYETLTAFNGEEALAKLRMTTPDLVLLDYQMTGMSGPQFARFLRGRATAEQIPIIFMTIREDIESKIAAYTSGGDDYITKPFDARELLLRVQAALRRKERDVEAAPVATVLSVGSLRLDLATATLYTAHGLKRLTPIELRLLRYFMERPGQLLSSAHLLEHIWGEPDAQADTAVLRWHVKNLRIKLELDPSQPRILRTMGRHGYILDDPGTSSPTTK